jgi:predicted PurR-regulated permease PerM
MKEKILFLIFTEIEKKLTTFLFFIIMFSSFLLSFFHYFCLIFLIFFFFYSEKARALDETEQQHAEKMTEMNTALSAKDAEAGSVHNKLEQEEKDSQVHF